MAVSDSAPPPDNILEGLRKWFKKQFGEKLMNMGNVLKRPRQTDTYSCSICAMSTIAHGVFGDPLWQQRDAPTHRINWLLKLSQHEESHVSVGPVSGLNQDEVYVGCLHPSHIASRDITLRQYSG